jgi:hypothetical protein
MTRQDAIKTINALYGFENLLGQAFEELGADMLTDAAVEWIARQQLETERRKGEHLDRVAKYREKHSYLSWSECEENLRLGIL